jgi:hypothetical protein
MAAAVERQFLSPGAALTQQKAAAIRNYNTQPRLSQLLII